MGLIFVVAMTMSAPANAKKGGMIGEKDQVHKIQSIDMKGKDGEKLYLGYMTESYFLIAGVYMKDAGYVIGIEGNDDSYYPMPTGDKLKSLQKSGVLPDPLPKYEIELMDYLFGFSLWILIAIAFIWGKLTK